MEISTDPADVNSACGIGRDIWQRITSNHYGPSERDMGLENRSKLVVVNINAADEKIGSDVAGDLDKWP